MGHCHAWLYGGRLDRPGAALIVAPAFRRKAHNPAAIQFSMKIRTRKFIGTIGLLILVVVWSLLGMTIAQTPWLASSKLAQGIFYVVAGLGWVLPAMPLISWMSRPDAPSA